MTNNLNRAGLCLSEILSQAPDALARVEGVEDYEYLCGTVKFYQSTWGVVVASEIKGLPKSCILAFHIHEGGNCCNNAENVGSHYNPTNQKHPCHAGDMPPLFSAAEGCAVSVFLTDRFCVRDVIGRTVIIHSQADDFTTQPSGNPGDKIACGEIKACV